MELTLAISNDAGASKAVKVSESAFGRAFNEALVHQVIVAYMAGARAGTRAQKNRAAVRGGGAKPWKQKGGGRARAGTIRSPLWRKGGVTFAAQPQDHSQKVNKSMYRGAMRSILSELIRQDRLVLVDAFAISQPKTRELVNKLKDLGLKKALVITETPDTNLHLASRNLIDVHVCDVGAADPVSLIKYPKVLITVPAIKKFEERLA